MVERPLDETATETFRVLIIDDNESIHRDFRSLLETKPRASELADLALEVLGEEAEPSPRLNLPRYAFDSAYQGRAALETVKEASSAGQSYALAFVDVRMPPGWDGVETIQRIWEIDPHIQMIICSAYSDYTWDEIVEALGASDRLLILRKPFDPNIVKQMALAVACKWSQERRMREHIARIADELSRLIGQLEALSGAELSDEHAQRIGSALDTGRVLLDEMLRKRGAEGMTS